MVPPPCGSSSDLRPWSLLRAVWLPVGHTHSESPAGVNGLSRLPSPGFENWVGSPVLFFENWVGSPVLASKHGGPLHCSAQSWPKHGVQLWLRFDFFQPRIVPAQRSEIATSSICTNSTSGFTDCKLTYKEVGRNPLNLPSIFQRRSGPRVWITRHSAVTALE